MQSFSLCAYLVQHKVEVKRVSSITFLKDSEYGSQSERSIRDGVLVDFY